MKLEFKTKSDTLAALYRNLKFANILPSYSFTVHEWISNRHEVIEHVLENDSLTSDIIVRSSCTLEV